MLKITFGGWVECRLATDPDPSDEPWGVSGYVRAYAGEPKLDRIIQTHHSKAVKRRFSPSIGMKIQVVENDEGINASHPLLGADLTFEGDPVFEGRNDLVAPDTIEPIVPMIISLKKNDISIYREMRNLENGGLSIVTSPGTSPRMDLLAESGVEDPIKFLDRRISELEGVTATGAEAVEIRDRLNRLYKAKQRGELDGNIADYNMGGPVPMFIGMTWHYIFQGPWWRVDDPSRALPETPKGGAWIMNLWMGCWDADVLCAYSSGTLELPSFPAHSRA